MTTRTRILDAILGVLPGARPDARITVEQPLQQGGRDTWTGMAASLADRIADAIEEGKDTRPGESTPTVSVRDVRTTVLVALSRALREQPTGARGLGGLEELGEAVVSADLGEIAARADALASLAHIDDALGSAAAQSLTVYRAEHETIPLGTYTTEGAARAHAESALSCEYAADRTVMYDWIGDEDDPEAPRELVAQVDGGDEQYTGYIVVPVAVAAAFAPDAE
ncbi:hypothetical protein OG413_15790 [Streptomyces sp. NBC_01433]|uniref:hypothetical protein n=1 Tax=Streptomyces sp. NBC_01433 TaxID=2903864 RepID=UPI00225B98BB|nr:hypothetical protein [Streptomyces sp. NBC_01433]MCX4676747.1 hypothetical protein [Streptomyces sp. NBC_01433]